MNRTAKLVFQIAPAAIAALCVVSAAGAQIPRNLIRKEINVSYGSDGWVSTNLQPITTQDNDRAGWYSISGPIDDGVFSAEIKVENSSTCRMVFEGTFYIGRTPVQFVTWGPGFELSSRESRTFTGRITVSNADVGQPLTFKPDGYVHRCS